MLVKEIMTKTLDTLKPTSSLQYAANHMKTGDFGFMPIAENGQVLGVITDRDIATRAVANGKDPQKTTVKDVMTKKVYSCHEKDNIKTVAQQMEKLQIRRLLVLNEKEQPSGILSLCDIARKCNDNKLCGDIIQNVSEELH